MGAEGADKEARNRAIIAGLGEHELDKKADEDKDSLKNKVNALQNRVATLGEKYDATLMKKVTREGELKEAAANLAAAKKQLREALALAEDQSYKRRLNTRVSSGHLQQERNSRAAKRARLKAKRTKLVSDYKHAESVCGNVGCKTCSPLMIAKEKQKVQETPTILLGGYLPYSRTVRYR
jgi:phage-related tail fiber protein